jgi:hypothetical protein
VFTLQVLPGTTVRQQAQAYGLRFQERPPYYVLGTDTLSYAELRRLRRDLKRSVNIAPDAVEGMPEPRQHALIRRADPWGADAAGCVDQLWLLAPDLVPIDERVINRLAAHVDVVLRAGDLAVSTPILAATIRSNPSTIFDIYISGMEALPTAQSLRQWREALPCQPGYLDRVAIYQSVEPAAGYRRVSPRCFLLLPWTSTVEPADFRDIAEIIWRFDLAANDPVPLNAWYGAGGSGVWLHFMPACTASYRSQVMEAAEQWERETGRRIWFSNG